MQAFRRSGGGHRWLQTLLLEGVRSTRARIHPQAIALMPPHSCNGHTSNRTRSNRDAKGQPPPPWTKLPTCATDPFDSVTRSPWHTITRTGQVSRHEGPRRLGPRVQECGSPQLPHNPMSLNPQCHTHAAPCRPLHLPPSWRLRGKSGGRAAKRWPQGGLRRELGLVGLCSARAAVGACVCPSVGTTAQRLRRPGPPPPHMPAPAGGGRVGQSGAALR